MRRVLPSLGRRSVAILAQHYPRILNPEYSNRKWYSLCASGWPAMFIVHDQQGGVRDRSMHDAGETLWVEPRRFGNRTVDLSVER